MTRTQLRRVYAVALLGILVAVAAPATAGVPFVFKHDQFDAEFVTALSQINGMSLQTQPGFAQGEAFGQFYRPQSDAFPLQITGVDLLMAAPPFAPTETTHATIEIYNPPVGTAGPDPGQLLFSVSTTQIWNAATQDFGLPLQGGIGYRITFDMEDDQNHPPLIFDGNLVLVVRFEEAPTQPVSDAWSASGCNWDDVVAGWSCGCQAVGTLNDSATTPNSNIMFIYFPSTCGGTGFWTWAESWLVQGDFVMRLHAEVASAPCVPECAGKVCGDDGCGGSCAPGCGDDFCVDGQCQSCLPSCTSKQCGDDGCGGTCGTCPDGKVCENFWCEAECVPDCAGRDCGDDGCGGTCAPGCTAPEVCTDDGLCEAPCAPDCDGKDCGDDGCGDVCGACEGGDVCGDDGVCFTPCAPDCDGKSCGPDGCGALCGTCADDEVCDDDGACEPLCAPACAGRDCGDDGCGGTCGACGDDETCSDAGACEATCAPDCADRACGDDGCGGTCGACDAGATCEAGACVDDVAPAALAITAISPAHGLSSEATSVSLTGSGFVSDTTALVGGTVMTDLQVVSGSVLTATVPAGLSPDAYDVIVTNPDGATATLADGFEVRAAGASSDGGCAGGPTTGGGLGLLLAALTLVALRRRRVCGAARRP